MKKKTDNAMYKFSIGGKDYRAWAVNAGIAQIEIHLNDQWQLFQTSDDDYPKVLDAAEYRIKRALTLKNNSGVPF